MADRWDTLRRSVEGLKDTTRQARTVLDPVSDWAKRKKEYERAVNLPAAQALAEAKNWENPDFIKAQEQKELTGITGEEALIGAEPPLWKQLGYPDWEKWWEDNRDKPDWERLGFDNIDDWKKYEVDLRNAGKTEINTGDENNARFQSYLAQLIGNNEDIFYHMDELGNQLMRPWSYMNENNRDRVMELWANLIRFESPELQSILMSMMETQLGSKAVGGDTQDNLGSLQNLVGDYLAYRQTSGTVPQGKVVLPAQPKSTPIEAGIGEKGEIIVGGEQDLSVTEQNLILALKKLKSTYQLAPQALSEVNNNIAELEKTEVSSLERMLEISKLLENIPRIYYDEPYYSVK